MITKRIFSDSPAIGRSSERLPVIGLGTWQNMAAGRGRLPDEALRRRIAEAVQG